MPRPERSAKLGQVRSLRLPLELDERFERRLRADASRCASDVLLEAVHGGLRLQPGYMWRQRVTLTSLLTAGEWKLYESYLAALGDTFERVRQAHRCVAAGGRHYLRPRGSGRRCRLRVHRKSVRIRTDADCGRIAPYRCRVALAWASELRARRA